jgi:riboflavin biosynthesis pyrimidine reductase
VNLERLYPAPSAPIDLEDRDGLLELYRPPRAEWLRLNLIASVTGAAGGSDGTSETLSNPVDRRILGVIRELADVVLIGAQSLRAEGYQHPRKSRLAVVTITGKLTGHRIEAPEGAAPIVLCPPTAVSRVLADLPGAEVIELPLVDGTIPPLALIDALRAAGNASIVCEGGPSLAGQLLETGAVDEFCLATSPRIGGRPFPATGPTAITEREVTLAQLLRDDADGMYARWAFRG